MSVRFAVVIFLGFICVSEPARAQSGDGTELLRKCSAGVKAADRQTLTAREITDAAWCAGYLHGVSDMQAITTAMGAQPLLCVPQDVRLGQQARIVVKFLQAHPEWMHVEGRLLVVGALKEAFACPSVRESQDRLSAPILSTTK